MYAAATGATLLLLLLRLVHLRADFPAYAFYSQDGARYSDEGFYTAAALNHFLFGHGILPGGWNPGIFMPVWPFLVGLVFHFTGISVTAARALAVVCTWGIAWLAYAIARQYKSRGFALAAAFLTAANALGFFFGRLALLEPAFTFFLLLAIYLAGRVRAHSYALAVIVGLVFVLATLTKTTGAFVLPAILYPIWANHRHPGRRRAALLTALPLLTAAILLAAVKLLWTRHYPADAAIILGLNPLWQLQHSPLRLARFFFRGTWIDPVLFPLAVAAFIAALTRVRSLWRDPLFTTAILWETGYAAFIVFHYDGPPRYFVPLVVPTIWLALSFAQWLHDRHYRPAARAVFILMALTAIGNIAAIANYLAHPRYRLVDAGLAIKQKVLHTPGTSPLLIGRAADQVALLAGGFPAMDTDGALPLGEKLDRYHPGWFMNWTDDSPLRPATVSRHRQMTLRATYPNLDPFNGAGIELYQLH